jgi:hypothetical protein
MMTLIAAALVAAQPAAVPASPPAQPAPMMSMADQEGQQEHGRMADMKNCCCKDMMAKMHGSHPAAHDKHSSH